MELVKQFGIGDLGFYMGESLFDKSIEDVERSLDHSEHTFIPSHVFMVLSLQPFTVVEAAINSHYNSVAAVDEGAQYQTALAHGAVLVVRPKATEGPKLRALHWLINNYQAKPYGTIVLFGFLLQRIFGLQRNPLGQAGDVCSQAAYLYLQRLVTECETDKDSEGQVDAATTTSLLEEANSTPDLLLLSCGVKYSLRGAYLRSLRHGDSNGGSSPDGGGEPS